MYFRRLTGIHCLLLVGIFLLVAVDDAHSQSEMRKDYEFIVECFENDENPETCVKEYDGFADRYETSSDEMYWQWRAELSSLLLKKAGNQIFIPRAVQLQSELSGQNLPALRASVLHQLGKSYARSNQFDSSDFYLNQGLRIAGAENIELSLAMRNRLASNLSARGDYSGAEQEYLKIIALSNEHEIPRAEASAYNGLGRLFGMNRLNRKSADYFGRASAIFFDEGDSSSGIKTSINQANGLIGMGMLDSAQLLLEVAEDFLGRNNEVYARIGCLTQLGRLYSIQSKYGLSAKAYKSALRLSGVTGNLRQQGYIKTKLAQSFADNDQLDSAERYALLARDQYEASGYNDEYREVFKTLASIYERQGHYDLAYANRLEFDRLTDSIMSSRKKEEILALEEEHKAELASIEVAELEQRNRQRRLRNIGLSVALVLVLIIASLLVNRQKLRNKANRLIAQEREKVLTAELDNQELRNEKLQLELARNKRELVSKALHIAEKNEMIDQLQLKLRQSKSEDKSLVKSLLQEIKTASVQEKEWDSFLEIFESVHPSLLDTIKKNHPGLSQNDLRLCALLRMNFTNKQIAAILHVSDEGVKKARYRPP